MTKKLTLFLLVLFCTATLASDLPRIAVYVTGDVPENEKKALGTRMLAALVNSGRYMGIERSNSFLAEIEREQTKQRSGAIDDSQISELGKQFGVKYVCVADITPAFRAHQVSARIVDVETAVVVFIGESSSPLKTMRDLTQVSNEVVRNMFGEDAGQGSRKPKTGMSAGAGGFFSGDFGGGVRWNRTNGQIAMPCYGGGAHLFFDAGYAQVAVAWSAGGGKWESGNDVADSDLLDMQRTSVNIGAYGKYPITVSSFGNLKAFPLLGIEYDASVSGKLVRASGSEYVFNGNDGRPKAGDLSALWFKFGGGVDVDLKEDMYLRSELLYGARTANTFEKDAVENSAESSTTKTRLGHGLTLRVGVGLKF